MTSFNPDRQIRNEYIRILLAEFLGTFILVCIGCSANAVITLNQLDSANFVELQLKNFTEQINESMNMTNETLSDISRKISSTSSFGPVLGPLAWGLALTVAIYACGGVSGGHVNPAVSLGLASIRKLDLTKLPWYFLGQYLGAFFGSLITYAVYYESINSYNSSLTIGIFGTYPNDNVNNGTTFVDQLVATMFFLLIICAVTDRRNMSVPKGLAPLIIGFANLGVLVMAFQYNCGAPINPARDFMPRLMTTITGWKEKPFTNGDYYFYIPLIACHLGGILGCWIYKLFIGNHLNDDDV